jgi:hypothetical protein
MQRVLAAVAALSAIALFGGAPTQTQASSHDRAVRSVAASSSSRASSRTFGRLPLSFEPNVGQADPMLSFVAHAPDAGVGIGPDRAILSIRRPTPAGRLSALMAARTSSGTPSPRTDLVMRLAGADRGAALLGVDRLPGISSSFIGHDPAGWHTNIPTFAAVIEHDVYPGIDLSYRGSLGGWLEYSFVVAPGADPRSIALRFDGQRSIMTDPAGALVLSLPGGMIREPPAFAYQWIGGVRREVRASYDLTGNTVRFALGVHDPARPLVIDPTISYSTYLGGTDFDLGAAVAVDRFGDAYVYGETISIDFPTTPGTYQADLAGGADDYIAKLNRDGTALLYSTYLGGSGDDESFGMTIDHAGDAYVAGPTLSSDFPTTPGAFQTIAPGGDHDGFVTELNPTGSKLVFSTYLGGSGHDAALTPVLTRAGDVVVLGDTNSTDLPVTPGAFQATTKGGDCTIFDFFDPGDCQEGGGLDDFVAELNPTGSGLRYLTYLGGTGDEVGTGMAVDRQGNAYVALETTSADFPVTPGAYQTIFAGGDGSGFDAAATDNVVVKLNPTGSGLVYSTYVGGSGDECDAFFCYLAIDHLGHAFLASISDSTDFPVTPGAIQPTNHGSFDLTVTELNAAGNGLLSSTYLGGSDYDAMFWDTVGRNGDAYIAGTTLSSDFPTADPVQASFGGVEDGFLSKLNHGGTQLVFSTYLGGSDADDVLSVAVDPSGAGYLTGYTCSTDFPTTAGTLQPSPAGGCDAFVTRIRTTGGDATDRVRHHGGGPSGAVTRAGNFGGRPAP